MNRERHAYWSAYIADLQGRMLLADWEVVLSHKVEGDVCWDAAVDFAGPKRYARIKLSAVFENETRTRQRYAIVHELVHVHLHPLTSHLRMQTQNIGEHEQAAICKGHVSHEEYAVYDLAKIIAPRMPLPPKVKA